MIPIKIETEGSRRLFKPLVYVFSFLANVLVPNHRHLYHRIGRILDLLFGGQITCIIQIRKDSLFRFCLFDPYWNKVLCDTYKYEIELEYVLKVLRRINYTFVDCGANFGYWSILASSEEFGSKPAIAIEASSLTYNFLQKNLYLNNNRFRILNRAIGVSSGERVKISYPVSNFRLHAAAATRPLDSTDGKKIHETVETISLEDLIKKYEISNCPIILKLDVEGSEIDAFKGAPDLFNHDLICIYEDHGNDPQCVVSQFLMNHGLTIFFIDDSQKIRQIFDWREIQGLKKQRSRGYNFIATSRNSQFFERLKELTKRS